MRIVHQSAIDSYFPFLVSPFLALPAPSLAGLLPARCVTSTASEPPIPPKAFTYSSPYLIDLSANQQGKIFDDARILLDVAVDYTRDLLNDHALNTAIAAFRQAVSGKPMQAHNPAEFNAEMDAPILEYMAGIAQIRARQAEKYAHVSPNFGPDLDFGFDVERDWWDDHD